MNRRTRSFVATIALSLAIGAALTGCGKSGSSTRPPSSEVPVEVRDQIAAQSAAQVGPNGPLAKARDIITIYFPPPTAGRGAQPHGVSHGDSDSLSLTSTMHIYNLAGEEVSVGTVTAEQVSHATFVSGSYYRHVSDSLNFMGLSTDTLDIAGFPSSQSRWVLNGAGNWTWGWDWLMSSAHYIYSTLARYQFSGVLFEKSGTPLYPVGGTVTGRWDTTWDLTTNTQHLTGTQAITSETTFDGTRYARLIVDGVRYTVDLETGTLVGAAGSVARASL